MQYFKSSMNFNIILPKYAEGIINNEQIAECAMLICAKRHNIKLGINSEHYPEFGKFDKTHHEYFNIRIAEICKRRRIAIPNPSASSIPFDLTWIDESPETLRFVKAVFSKPEFLFSTFQYASAIENKEKFFVPMVTFSGATPAIQEFKNLKRQFIQLKGLKSNFELIITNFISLTLSHTGISNLILLTHNALRMKKLRHPTIKALGIRTPTSAVSAWMKSQNIEPSTILHIERIIKYNKALPAEILNAHCINIIQDHNRKRYKDPEEIAKKIRNHYHNSKKILDGRSVMENKAVKIIPKKEILQKLENHKKITGISHSELIEELLIRYFKENPTKKH